MFIAFGLLITFFLGIVSSETIRFMIELHKDGRQLKIEESKSSNPDKVIHKPQLFTYWYICICGYATDRQPREHMNSWNELIATNKTSRFDPCPECGQVDGSYERTSARMLPSGKLEMAKA